MHVDPSRVRDRLTRFVAESLRPAVHRDAVPLDLAGWDVPGEPVPFAVAARQRYVPFAVGARWGRPWSTLWLRARGAVPEEWMPGGAATPGTRVEVLLDLGFDALMPGFQAEGLAFRPDGTVVKAISPRNAHVPVDGASVDLFLELAGNPGIPPESHFVPTALGTPDAGTGDPMYTLRRADLVRVDVAAWELLQDVAVLRGLADELPPEAPRTAQVWAALDRMLDVADPVDVAGTAPAARAVLAPALAAPAAASAHTLVATGHAHIDSAWLWPLRETIRKCARTFSNVLSLMDEHPEFRFACSSAQQFAWVKEYYPDLYARIREKVASGQFVPVGGQWVEPDANLPGGEATVRQLVVGKRFFLEEFGIDTREVWLPDTFGYSAALPQIIRLSGSDWFMTQKISWNQTNRMPHHTFAWEGIDGTRVLTHFPPIETYNAELTPAELAHAQRNYRDHAAGSVSLAPFGFGDGGGGPTREMVAAAHRQADLDGSPRVVLGTPADFLDRVRAEVDELPVWSGEMYLELHRGTLTSQLRTKQGNRRAERLLHELEVWAATAAVRTGALYPYALLQRAWREVLLLQFHDILPGSSIAWVHRETEARHARLADELEAAVRVALAALTGAGDRVLTANSAPLALSGVPALAVEEAASAPPAELIPDADGWILRTDALTARVDAAGLVVSLRAAEGREAVPAGERAGLLRLHRDRPDKWDAWDVDRHHRAAFVDLAEADEVTAAVVDGVATVRAVRRAPASTIVQTVSLAPGSAALDLTVEVDWHERHTLLKMLVPVDVQAERSTSEIQFGQLERVTHANTSWDEARFEFAAQRWIHVGEPGFGLSVANDSSHGHAVRRVPHPAGGYATVVEVSVLRSPVFPDPEADQGRHVVRYALRPGATPATAAEDGHRLDRALRTVRGGSPVSALVHSDDPGVRISAVKLAEDRSGDLVVRVHEALGARRTTVLSTDALAASVQVVDLLERPLAEAATHADPARVTLTLRPFEIVTLRYRPGGSEGVPGRTT